MVTLRPVATAPHKGIKRVFLDHGEAYGNLGDDAMLMAAHQRIEEAFEGAVEFVVPCRDGATLPSLSNASYIESARDSIPQILTALLKERWGRILYAQSPPYFLERWIAHSEKWIQKSPGWCQLTQSLGCCDALYSVGCGNMNDLAPHVTLLYRLALAKSARRMGIPLITSSQGLGPLRTKWSQSIAREIFQLSDHFSLRTELPCSNKKDALTLIRKRAEVVGDEAFSLKVPDQKVLKDALLRQHINPERPYIIVHYRSASYVGATHQTLSRLAEALRSLSFTGDFLFVPMSESSHSGLDVVPGDYLRRLLSDRECRFHVLRGLKDPRLVKALVWNASGVIALSYHLQIFALSGAIPFVILSQGRYYAEKAEGVCRLAGTRTPVLDLEMTAPGPAGWVLNNWFSHRASQIAELKEAVRRIAPVNNVPVQQLSLKVNHHDTTKRKYGIGY